VSTRKTLSQTTELGGVRVIVGGAGFAGLSAAYALEQKGADVTVIEARDRVGGRVWTIRDTFDAGQHAEAGADMIESDQQAMLDLAGELGLTTSRILRRGFGYYGTNRQGRLSLQPLSTTFASLGALLWPLMRDYQLAEKRWDGAIAARLSKESVAHWLSRVDGDPWLLKRVRALRGLFLADPEDLSLLALVDFFADQDSVGPDRMTRLTQGNDALATSIAQRLRHPPTLGAVLRRVRQNDDGVIATIEEHGRVADRRAEFLVSSLPATTLRAVAFEPALPPIQQEAIARLRYGSAARALLQFSRRFWRKTGRPLAFGSDQATGAVWDGNEQQRGPAGILSLLAGGGASRGLQEIVQTQGPAGIVNRLAWLGRPTTLLSARTIVWEDDSWARGGYAYFDPTFDPRLRDALAHPAGRIVFAGEHTSIRWQGYMNGAIESGQRAAAEVLALAGQRPKGRGQR